MKKLSIVFATFLFSQISFANERGNGGDAVVCRDKNGSIIKAELLDYYEGRALRKIPNLLPDSADPELLKDLTNKLTSYEPLVFKPYKYEAQSMLVAFQNYRGSDIKTPGYVFVEREIEDIQDSMELFMPRGCRVEQLVIRAVKKRSEDPAFIVQGEILKALPERDVMGIVIHELIYGAFAIELGYSDSRAARLFHQRLMSQKIEELSFFSFAKHTAEVRENIYKENYTMAALPIPLPEGYSMHFTSLGFQGIFNSQGELDISQTNKRGKTWVNELVARREFPNFAVKNFRNMDYCDKKYGKYSGTLTIKTPLGIEKKLTYYPLRSYEQLDLYYQEIILPFLGMTEVSFDFPAPKPFDARCLPEITFNLILGRDKNDKLKLIDTVKLSPQGYQSKKKLSFSVNDSLKLQMTVE